jgi:uncharacterized protein HemY
MLVREHQEERAVPELKAAISLDSRLGMAHFLLGRLNESFSGPYVTLGQIALKRRDFELAAGLLERAVKMEPNNQNAHYALAKTYQKLGRTDDANRHFELSRSLLTEKN